MKTIHVELGERTYPIIIGPYARAVIQKCDCFPDAPGQVVVIADENVARLHGERLLEHLPREAVIWTFPAGEGSKSPVVVERFHEQLAAQRIERGGLIITLGGGVAGDLGGYVAATWLRGIRFVQVPTSTLAAVDASVGGKTGVNLRAGKNLVGAFHQPGAVIIDTEFLATLPAREFAAGLAESVKQAAIRSVDFFEWHERNADRLHAREGGVVAELIARNCGLKAEIVARDERETGVRAILNYGHTIGHAVEHLLEYELRHGECVALGMLAENEIAVRRGLLGAGVAKRVRGLIEKLGLPTRLPRALAVDAVVAACRVDKKARGGAVRYVLLKTLGETELVADVRDGEVGAGLGVIQPG